MAQPFSIAFKWAVVDRVIGRRRPDRSPATTPRVAPYLAALREPPAAPEWTMVRALANTVDPTRAG